MSVDSYRSLYPDSNLMSQAIRDKKSKNVVSPYRIESWIKKRYTKDEAVELVSKYQENNSKKNKLRSPRTLQHWIDKGYNEDDARHRFQDNRSLSKLEAKYGSLELAKLHYKCSFPRATLKSNTSAISARQLKYWTDCGFSYDDAKSLVANVQGRSLDFFISKYGQELGTEKFNSWVEKTIRTSGSVSTESIDFFNMLLEKTSIPVDDVLYNKKELTLKHSLGFYKYDFTILSMSVIIEYNGVAWHPKSSIDSWVHPHKLYTAHEKFEIDSKKIKLAQDNGYKVITVFSDEDKDEALMRILKELNLNGTN